MRGPRIRAVYEVMRSGPGHGLQAYCHGDVIRQTSLARGQACEGDERPESNASSPGMRTYREDTAGMAPPETGTACGCRSRGGVARRAQKGGIPRVSLDARGKGPSIRHPPSSHLAVYCIPFTPADTLSESCHGDWTDGGHPAVEWSPVVVGLAVCCFLCYCRPPFHHVSLVDDLVREVAAEALSRSLSCRYVPVLSYVPHVTATSLRAHDHV